MTEPRDDPRIPPLSLVLGFGPVALILAAGIAAWAAPQLWGVQAILIGQLWAAAILIFLAGVRRGLSFFTDGGPRPIQIATTIWLFVLGLAGAALAARFALPVMIVGYASIMLLDPRAAKRGEVPTHFARLRPWQMAVAVIGLAAMMARVDLGWPAP